MSQSNIAVQQEPAKPVVKMVIRGKVIDDNLISIGGREENSGFQTPDISRYIGELSQNNPNSMTNLHELSVNDIIDFLVELGERLNIETNPLMQEACRHSHNTSGLTPSIVDFSYSHEVIKQVYSRESLLAIANQVGVDYLDGWVETPEPHGGVTAVRCFGARTLFIVAGNSPVVSSIALVRCILLRSDGIFKAPSNDPFTASAIIQTMVEMAPDHPITKHVSVAYWAGGDTEIEEQLYQPHNIEKICAWGGYASMKHVTKYIQPGLELISFDPKLSCSFIGAQTFDTGESMREAAGLLARDAFGLNQSGCSNARQVYVETGTDEDGVSNLQRFGRYVYDAMLELPPSISTKPLHYNPELKRNVDALRMDDDWYTVIGGENDEGAIIVSHLSDAVDFAGDLADRTVNLIPVDNVDDILNRISAYTQTMGVYPENVKSQVRDKLALAGVQRFVSLGNAIGASDTGPADGLEPMRRMGKWIADEVDARFVKQAN